MSGYNSSSSKSFYNLTPKLRYQHEQQQQYNYRHPINSYISHYKQQQQFNQQKATRNTPFWDTKIDQLNSQDLNNKTSLSQELLRFPQAARMRSNNTSFPSTYLAANFSNTHRKPNKDFSIVSASHYNLPPQFLINHYSRTQGRQPERVGMVNKMVDLSSRIVPKETNMFELIPKLNPKSDNSKSGSEPDNVDAGAEEEEGEGGGGGYEEKTSSGVKPEFRSNNNNNNKDIVGGESNEQQQEEEKQAAEEEQEQEGIRRRSWQEEQAETKTGSTNKSVKKINPATRSKQSRLAQILSNNRESERIIPSGRDAGSKLEKKTPPNGDNKLHFQQNLGRIKSSDNRKKLAKEIGDGFTSQKLTKAMGKLRANVSELRNIGNQKESIDKKLIKLRHPDRQIGRSKAKKSPRKEYHNHRVKESLTAQHWDDDASSPIKSRAQKPPTDDDSRSDYKPEAEDEDEDDNESESGNDDQDGEDSNQPYDLGKEDDEAKEEMEAEAETGPQQVAPEWSELDLVEDPEQFMHASDRRRKRNILNDETKTTSNDVIMLSISKDSPIKDSSKSAKDFDILERLGWIR